MQAATEQEPARMRQVTSRRARNVQSGVPACDLQGRCGRRGAWPLFVMAGGLVVLGAVTGSTGWFWLAGMAGASALFWEVAVRLARAAGRGRGGC